MKQRSKTVEELTFLREDAIRQNGFNLIAGVDEAGRGPLAGPVVAAAVILPSPIDAHVLAGIRDSKALNEAQRLQFYHRLTQLTLAYAVGQASPREIEKLNIRQASLLAMKRAVEKLNPAPEYVLVDGRDYPEIEIQGEAIIRGDQTSVSIGAASIIAKVVRDRIMTALHQRYSHYGFDQHKGYPTKYHRVALELFGSCDLHRCTYAGVSESVLVDERSPKFSTILKKIAMSDTADNMLSLLNTIQSAKLSANERYYLEQRFQYHSDFLNQKERHSQPASRDKGSEWESHVIDYLNARGYELWERNFKGSKGEIDLIVNKGSLIAFVEVKSRSSEKFGQPYESIGKKKRQALIATADEYLYKRDLLNDWDIRYDIASIIAPKNKPIKLEYIEDAFRVEEEF